MTDAAATAEITDPLQTHTDGDPIDNMSPAELIAFANKMGGQVEEPKAPTPDPTEVIEGAHAVAPAVTEEAPAATEAPAVDPKEAERAERLASVLARAGDYKQKQALRDAQAKHEAEVARYKAEAEATKAEAAALKARLDAYKDPKRALEAFEQDGIPADVIAQSAIRQGTPEYKAEQELASLKAEIAAIKADREAAAKAQAEERAKYEESQKSAHLQRIETEFVKQAADDTKYPTLSKLAKFRGQAIVEHAKTIIDAARAREPDAIFDNEQVLTYMESLYATELGLTNPKSGSAASVTSTGTAAGTSAPGMIAAGKPRTLSNGMVEKTAVNSVAADEMSPEEFKRWAASQVART